MIRLDINNQSPFKIKLNNNIMFDNYISLNDFTLKSINFENLIINEDELTCNNIETYENVRKISYNQECVKENYTFFDYNYFQYNYDLYGYNEDKEIDLFNDFSLHFNFSIEDYNCDINYTGDSVNYQEDNFLFYCGLKSTDNLCGYNVTGTTCEVLYEPHYTEIITNDFNDNENKSSLLKIYKDDLCQKDNDEIIIKNFIQENCSDLNNNMFCIKINKSNQLELIKFSNNSINIKKTKSLFFEQTNNLILNFKEKDKCNNIVNIEIWLNQKLIQVIENYEMIYPTHLRNIQKEYQIGKPYTINIGGGNVESKENYDNLYEKLEDYNIYHYNIKLKKDDIINSLIINNDEGIMLNDTINIYEKELIDTFLEVNLEEDSEIESYLYCNELYINIKTKDILNEFILFNGEKRKFKLIEINSYTHECECNIINEYCYGSFKGNIYCFNMFSKSLNYEEIKFLEKSKPHIKKREC